MGKFVKCGQWLMIYHLDENSLCVDFSLNLTTFFYDDIHYPISGTYLRELEELLENHGDCLVEIAKFFYDRKHLCNFQSIPDDAFDELLGIIGHDYNLIDGVAHEYKENGVLKNE